MLLEPMERADRRLVAGALVLIAAAALCVSRYYTAAFPQASISLTYSKDQIRERAAKFLAGRGLATDSFRNLTLFDPDDSARLFLERELGLEEANRLMTREVSVWRWRVRWFRPPEQEERVVFLSPDGRLVGFRHVIPESSAGARMERGAAREIAERFLRERTTLPHRLIEEQLQERPNRHDYVFLWEQDGFRAKDATYRRRVVVQGGSIGEYAEYLHVPERWQREYAELRSANELYTTAAQALSIALILAAVAVTIRSLRRRAIAWRPLLMLSGAAAVLAVFNEWNFLPFFIDGMPTSSRYRDMVLLGLLQGLGAGVGYFFYILLGAAPGEPLYRASQPVRLRLGAAFTTPGLRSREFFRATVAGYGLAAAHLVFLIAFYLVGRRFGAWSPQDVGYSNVLSTAAPWLYPLTIGVLASMSEEFWFRLLAIPLLKRYLRSTWLAVLIPAFVWGFLHANYPQQPGYIRGVEVGLIGVAAGWIFLRFGILATLIWHYTIDAVLVSTILFESSSLYLRAAGIVVSGAALIPLGYGLLRYRRDGGFSADAALRNASVAEAPGPAVERGERRARPAIPPSWPARYLYLAAGAALAAGLWLQPPRYGDFISVEVSRTEAMSAAREALRGRGVDPLGWRASATFLPNLEAAEFEYLRRLGGAAEANRIVAERTLHGVWYVRFVRPLEPEEWRVYVNQTGEAYRIDHVLAETAPGPNLESQEARRRAEEHLRERQAVSMERYRLVDSSSSRKPKRTDHHFVWEDPDFRAGEARARISVSVSGGDPEGYRRFLKLPEEWLREFNRPRLRSYLAPAAAGALVIPLLIVFVRRLSSGASDAGHRFHWKAYLVTGALGAGLSLAGAANQWVNLIASYDTAEPLQNHTVQWLLGRLTLALLLGLGAMFAAIAADVFLQLAAGDREHPRPSFGRSVAAGGLIWGVYRVIEAARAGLPGDWYDLPLWELPGADTAFPAVAILVPSFFGALLVTASTVVLACGAWRFLRNRYGVVLMVALVALLAFSRSAGLWQWLFHVAEAGLALALLVFLVKTCGLDVAGLGVALFWAGGVTRSLPLLRQPDAALLANGAAALVCAALAGAAFLARVNRGFPPQRPPRDASPAA